MIEYLFSALFFLLPLFFFPNTSELFEFNKIILIYIFTILITSAWIIKIIKNYKNQANLKLFFRPTILDKPLIIFITSQILATIFSIDTRTSIFGYYSRFNGGLLSIISYSLLYWAFVSNLDRKNTLLSIRSALASATIVSVYAILEHFGKSPSCLIVTGKWDDNCWVQDVQSRVFATIGQPNWLAAFLTSLSPLALAIPNKSSRFQNFLKRIHLPSLPQLSLSLLFFVGILFTKSRSGLLGLAVAHAIYWIGTLRKKTKLILTQAALLLLASLIFGTPWSPSINSILRADEHKPAMETTMQDSLNGGTESGEIRKIVWKGAINIWKAYPIFGTGVETFGYSYWQFRPAQHNQTSEWDFLYNKAHNEYLNFLSTTGIVGLIAYLVLISFSIIQILKGRSNLHLAILAGYVSILITNFFGFSVTVISLLTFLFPAIAFTLNQNKKKISSTNPKKLSNGQKFGFYGVAALCAFMLYLTSVYWYADVLYESSTREFQNGNYQESIKKIQEAINLSPQEPIFHNQMAKILTSIAVALKESEGEESAKIAAYAVRESDIAFSLSERNMNIRQTRINMYGQLSVFDPSFLDLQINFIKDTIPLSPTDPKLELYLGKAYGNKGDKAESIKALNKALELKPDYKDAQKALQVIKEAKN